MIANHVHDALRQVRELKQRVMDSQRFTGYSGIARATGGLIALAGALVMNSASYPRTMSAHLAGWGIVMVLGVIINYAPVVHWFISNPAIKRDIRRLNPALDPIAPLLVGGILCMAIIRQQTYSLLFGACMCVFGLTNLSSRRVLPKAIWLLGAYYIICGAVCLLVIVPDFTNPLPMGMVFFVGELLGGMIFHYNRVPNTRLAWFFKTGE